MFGYVKPDNPNLYVKDTVLYKSVYCGLCKSLGNSCGQTSRFTLNYDMTFLSALFHNIMGIDFDIERKRCVAHWFNKRPIAKVDELTKELARLNVILTYNKLLDDKVDKDGGAFYRLLLKKAYKKALEKSSNLDEIVKKGYDALRNFERMKSDSIDMVADTFATMFQNLAKEILKEDYNEDIAVVCYNLGKWIYLIDALDDYDKDIKRDRYNVLFYQYNCKTKKELIENYKNEIIFTFGSIFSCINEHLKRIKFKYNSDLTDNILTKGLFMQTKCIMQKTGKKEKKNGQ